MHTLLTYADYILVVSSMLITSSVYICMSLYTLGTSTSREGRSQLQRRVCVPPVGPVSPDLLSAGSHETHAFESCAIYEEPLTKPLEKAEKSRIEQESYYKDIKGETQMTLSNAVSDNAYLTE